MTISHFFIVFATTLALSAASYADVVTIGVGHQAATKQSLSRPYKGMEKQQVHSRFGDPVTQTNTIGEPPISSWVFDEFTVYFEYDHVLHTVLHDPDSKPIE